MLPPSVEEAIRGIAEDRTSGASKLARLALEVMGLAIMEAKGRPDPKDLAEAARRISDAQPAMSIVHNVAHLVAQLVGEGQEPKAVFETTREELDAAREKIARTFLKVAPDRGAVVTVSYSENVLEALRTAHGRGRVDRVFVMESRPLFEGRTLAKDLGAAGIPVTLVADTVGPSLMDDAACALVGADAVLRDAAVVNKVGTYGLALAAMDRKKPFYVACESLKFDARYDAASWPVPGPRPPEEVWDARGDRIEVLNRYFEITPGRLVTTTVTERGTYAPDVIRTMLAQARAPRPVRG
ncbi:MAG TPA: hypothetical protein VF992_00305 [Thermoplasmata archaeon]